MEIIASLEDPSTTATKANCARQYGVTPAAISKLMKVSHSVKKRYSDAGSDSSGLRDKRQRGGFSKNVPFEDQLYRWICSVRARKVPLQVSHVQKKAKLLASRHKMKETFKASNGWYYRFCGRYGLTPASLYAGVLTLIPMPRVRTIEMQQERKNEDWTKLKDKVTQFGPEFVYTVGEAKLFYQVLPKVISVKREHEKTKSAAAAATDMIDDNVEGGAATQTPEKIARILVLLCVNGTGTHKIPLLVIGKEGVPSYLAVLHSQPLRGANAISLSTAGIRICNGSGMCALYYCQHDVWCDGHTFKHWCEHVFLPAVRQRTTRPVLIVSENPGGRLSEFQQENVFTMFLPLQTASGCEDRGTPSLQQSPSTAVGVNTNANSLAQVQALHGAVIHDLKRRYKIGLFQERLGFLETSDEEKRRLIQLAAKKQLGSAGVAFGRTPHLLDAMSLLDDAWSAIPSSLIRSAWMKSSFGGSSLLSGSMPEAILEQSDNAIVMELCSMIRNMNLADDINEVAKDMRQWIYVDDDSSEQMQQELLYDIQQLLQDEEQQQESDKKTTNQQQMQLHHQQSATSYIDISGLLPAFEPNQPEYVCRSADGRAAPVVMVDPSVALEEKHKSVEVVLQALARAEEALDNSDVAEYFGKEAAGQTAESISRALRTLRRIQRGKQSALVAIPLNFAASGDANDSSAGALSTHQYFYGSGALQRNF
ncbi:unnamed protein product [Peronospora destructor]|nr:unnamed protein product [Peronospora destructor]